MTGSEEQRTVGGRYRLVRELGRGGMGTVWAGHDELLGRDVAIKEVVPPPDLPAEQRATLRQRTLREARAAARISSAAAVTVYDVVEEDGKPWIVMEMLAARTLAHIVREEGPLSPSEAAAIGLRVLDALEAAHAAGVLHRDVKPSNVLVGADGRAVLTDFGIATLDGDPSITSTGMLVGSPAYMAPERVRGDAPTRATDLWALGATLYVAVEGHAPFEREGQLPTLTAVLTDPVPDAPHAGPLAAVLDGLLVKDPAERIDAGTARAMLSEAARSSAPAAPRPAEPLDEEAARTQRLPILAPAVGGGVVAGAAAAAGAGTAGGAAGAGLETGHRPGPDAAADDDDWPDGTAPHRTGDAWPDAGAGSPPGPPGRDPYEQRRRGPGVLIGALVGLLALALLGVWLATRDNGSTATATKPPGTTAPRASAGGTSAASPDPNGGASTPPKPSPAGSAPATPSPGASATGRSTDAPALPAGWKLHEDRTGFAVGVPEDWRVSREGTRTYFRSPDGRRFLHIDQTDKPKDDPVADWTRQEQTVSKRLKGYQLVGIEAVEYRGWKTADWEYTWNPGKGRVHVRNRGVVTDPEDQAYSLFWSVPDAEWQDSLRDFDAIAASFRPDD